MPFNPGDGGGIAQATDVAFNNVQDNQALTYDSSSAKWQNANAGSGYADHRVWWNGSSWNYQGGTISARPSVPTGVVVVWDTRRDNTYDTPPPLAAVWDQWEYHKDVTPVSA